jgi:hypothetical protein
MDDDLLLPALVDDTSTAAACSNECHDGGRGRLRYGGRSGQAVPGDTASRESFDDPMILHDLVFSLAWGTGTIPYILQRCDENLLQRCDEDFDRPVKSSVAGVLRTSKNCKTSN